MGFHTPRKMTSVLCLRGLFKRKGNVRGPKPFPLFSSGNMRMRDTCSLWYVLCTLLSDFLTHSLNLHARELQLVLDAASIRIIQIFKLVRLLRFFEAFAQEGHSSPSVMGASPRIISHRAGDKMTQFLPDFFLKCSTSAETEVVSDRFLFFTRSRTEPLVLLSIANQDDCDALCYLHNSGDWRDRT